MHTTLIISSISSSFSPGNQTGANNTSIPEFKLGPRDFGIHKRKGIDTLNLKKGAIITALVVSQGRWKEEYIAKINDYIGIKILLNKPLTLTHSEDLIGKEIKVKVIKANYQDNIITAVFPIKK